MSTTEIRFTDGAGYEQYMGKWSQVVGNAFLDWLALQAGMRWLDVGCGNGTFTELLVERCAPRSVRGIDPSEEQLAFARTRPALQLAQFQLGDAMKLPFPDAAFDVAVMPLVIFFVPDPAKGVAEMARVVSPGGTVAAYAWDMAGGGFPYDALLTEMRAMELAVPTPPSSDASRIDALRDLWIAEGLDTVKTNVITVERTFVDFEEYWSTILLGPSVGRQLATMPSQQVKSLKSKLQARLPADSNGRITYQARANAVKGQMPISF